MVSFIVFCVHTAHAQESRGHAYSFGPLVAAGLMESQEESGQLLKSFQQQGVSLGYSKKLTTFFDLKVTGSFLSGAFSAPINVVNSVGRQVGEVNRQQGLHMELLPIWYSNPNRLGYLPCRYLFYLGAGSGMAFGRFSVRNTQELTPNEQALLAYGFLERESQDHIAVNRLFVPLLVGIKQNRNSKPSFGIEVKLNYFVKDQLPAFFQNVRIPGWVESKFYVEF